MLSLLKNNCSPSKELSEFSCDSYSSHLNCGLENNYRNNLHKLQLSFCRDELVSYTNYRKTQITRKSADWIDRASRAFWHATEGTVSKTNLDELRESTLAKYGSQDSINKVLTFARAFLLCLSKTHLDSRFRAFDLFLKQAIGVKRRKYVTNRIVTKEDIEHVIKRIKQAELVGKISKTRAKKYSAFTIFDAFTGQRSTATMMKITVGQFRDALTSLRTACAA